MGIGIQLAMAEMKQQESHALVLREHFLAKLKEHMPNAVINGSLNNRLPNNLSVGFPGIDSGSLLLSLNQIGVFVSAGSACSAGDDNYSHVLKAIGVSADVYGTVRFSFGMSNTLQDIDYLFQYLPSILEGLNS